MIERRISVIVALVKKMGCDGDASCEEIGYEYLGSVSYFPAGILSMMNILRSVVTRLISCGVEEGRWDYQHELVTYSRGEVAWDWMYSPRAIGIG